MSEQTPRQTLRDRLRAGAESFEALRLSLGLRRPELEAELRHVQRTARQGGERLSVSPAECEACGFVFRDRALRHLAPPGRCPRCRSERISEPVFRLVPE